MRVWLNGSFLDYVVSMRSASAGGFDFDVGGLGWGGHRTVLTWTRKRMSSNVPFASVAPRIVDLPDWRCGFEGLQSLQESLRSGMRGRGQLCRGRLVVEGAWGGVG